MKSLGIDIGGTSVKLALLENGRQVWTGQSGFYSKPTPERLVAALREAAAGRVDRVDACGICVPGIQNEERTMVILSVNVPGLNNLPLSKLVGDAFGPGVPGVKTCNDAISCASDIVITLGLQGRTMVLAMGTGVGAAVIDVAGETIVPLLVDGESPGHIGMLDVTCDDPPTIGPDGGAGSLEGYCGVPALRKRFGENVNAAIEKLDDNDVMLRALARAIRIGHAMFRPHHVVLAGGIGTRLKPKLEALTKLVETNLTSIARPERTLQTAADDFHAARGAARLAGK